MVFGKFLAILVVLEVQFALGHNLKAGEAATSSFTWPTCVHRIESICVAISRYTHAISRTSFSSIAESATIYTSKNILRLCMDHRRDERSVQHGVAELRSKTVASEVLLLSNTDVRLGSVRNKACAVVVNVVVEDPGTIYFECNHKDWQRCHSPDLLIGSPASLEYHQKDDQIGKKERKEHAIKQHPPRHAAALILGDENIHQQIFLEDAVDNEEQSHRWQNERLDGCITECDGAVEEAVIVVAGVVEGLRGSELDHFTRRGGAHFPFAETPDQLPNLSQIHGRAKLSLQKIGDPVRGNSAKSEEDRLSEMLIHNRIPGICTLICVVHDSDNEGPHSTEK